MLEQHRVHYTVPRYVRPCNDSYLVPSCHNGGARGTNGREPENPKQQQYTAIDAKHAFLFRLLSSSARFQFGLIISKVNSESWGITLRGSYCAHGPLAAPSLQALGKAASTGWI